MTSIYDYLDYHQFLRDRYREIRARNPAFTYRALARMVGLRSAGQVSSILQGKRNISSRCIIKFARAFCLTKGETPYLQLLVNCASARSHVDRQYHFEKIVQLQKRNRMVVDESKYRFFSHWYYAAIRELIDVYDIREDTPDIGKLLVPSISPAEARDALQTLLALGLIRKDEQGRYVRVDRTIVAPDDWRSMAIHTFQIETADLGKEALDRIPKEDRNISTLTMSISRKTFEDLRAKLVDLWNEAMIAAAGDGNPEQVFHLNLQLFPLSKPRRRHEA